MELKPAGRDENTGGPQNKKKTAQFKMAVRFNLWTGIIVVMAILLAILYPYLKRLFSF